MAQKKAIAREAVALCQDGESIIVNGGTTTFQDDPHWRDLILFYEYFHGDNGAGLGASHQTGWSGLIAVLVDLFARVDAKSLLESQSTELRARLVREQVGGEH